VQLTNRRPIDHWVIVADLLALLAWWVESRMKETAGEMQALLQSCVSWMVLQPEPLTVR
jgi:hypothetical protein